MAKIDNSLTTLARLKSFLGISGSTKDTVLTLIIIAVSAWVERYCRRSFKQAAVSNEEYDGSGTSKLLLNQYPVIEGETFTLQRRDSNKDDGSWQTIDSENYIVKYDSGIIEFLAGEFSKGRANFRVSYTAGYYLPSASEFDDDTDDDQDLPADLELQVMKLCSAQYNNRKNANVKSSRVRDVSITYMTESEKDTEMKKILNFYKKPKYS